MLLGRVLFIFLLLFLFQAKHYIEKEEEEVEEDVLWPVNSPGKKNESKTGC